MGKNSVKLSTHVMLFLLKKYDVESSCKNMYKLLLLACLIPASTAGVERGFSLMNLTCNALRSSLNQTNLDYLMRTSLYDKTFSDDDWEKMIDIFRDSGNRRLDL